MLPIKLYRHWCHDVTCCFTIFQVIRAAVLSSYFLFFLLIRPPPISPLFPYTTLFRSTPLARSQIRRGMAETLLEVLGGVGPRRRSPPENKEAGRGGPQIPQPPHVSHGQTSRSQ